MIDFNQKNKLIVWYGSSLAPRIYCVSCPLSKQTPEAIEKFISEVISNYELKNFYKNVAEFRNVEKTELREFQCKGKNTWRSETKS